jgi:hypothetical protein
MKGQTKRLIGKVLIVVLFLAMFGIAALGISAILGGCVTPETLKESLSLTDQAVDLCIESTPDNSVIAKPLRDVRAGLAPVKLYIGAPETPVKYDSQSDMAVMKAELAASEVRQQQMMKNFFQNFARDVLPSQLKSLVPAPEGLLSGGNLEMLIVIVLGYLTSKGGLKIGGKILARKNGNGNGGNKS